MLSCCWLEDETLEEVRSHPEHGTQFNERDDDEVEEREAVELTSRRCAGGSSAESIRARMCAWIQGRNRSIRSGNSEEKGTGEHVSVIIGVGTVDHNVDGWWQVGRECEVHLF